MDIIQSHLVTLTKTIAKLNMEAIYTAIQLLSEAQRKRKNVFLFGNGGSHATASHFANDLSKACGIRAICISDLVPIILAYMNDIGPGAMFALTLRNLASKDDLLIAFSCSGNSENVVNALRMPLKNAKKLLFTGNSGGTAANFVDVPIFVPHGDIKIQESVHLALCHAITEVLSE